MLEAYWRDFKRGPEGLSEWSQSASGNHDRWDEEFCKDDDLFLNEGPIADHIQEYLPKLEPIVREARVGRNERCPCGSGKKYKNCCLRNVPK
jgi:hypothetical protein